MSAHNIEKEDRREIEEFLAMDEEQLYAILPSYIPEYRGTLFAPNRQVMVGKELFHEMQGDLQKVLCEDWHLCDKIDLPKWDDSVTLVATIGDLIATHVVGTIPPFVIATLLVKIGLRAFCSCKN
jgi:hypothetical protein